jgi:hypothetical protein
MAAYQPEISIDCRPDFENGGYIVSATLAVDAESMAQAQVTIDDVKRYLRSLLVSHNVMMARRIAEFNKQKGPSK